MKSTCFYFHTVFYNSNLYISIIYNFCNVNTFYITNISIVYIHTYTLGARLGVLGAAERWPREARAGHSGLRGEVWTRHDCALRATISTRRSVVAALSYLCTVTRRSSDDRKNIKATVISYKLMTIPLKIIISTLIIVLLQYDQMNDLILSAVRMIRGVSVRSDLSDYSATLPQLGIKITLL